MYVSLFFFEDYRKIIVNIKQEKPKISIEKLYWRVRHVSVGIPQQLDLSKILDKNIEILFPFRSWELVEYPFLTETSRHTWPVKTTTKLETPRHIIVALQTDIKKKITSNMSNLKKNVKIDTDGKWVY